MQEDYKNQNQLERLADFVYEAEMLKKTPRSGFAFLGTGGESVADHSFATALIGFVLANMANADAAKTVLICLLHDFHEAATGDFNYVNHRYNKCDAGKALADACGGTGLGDAVLPLWAEFEQRSGLEAQLARDADQLDLICVLRKELSAGNGFAAEWLDSAIQRITTEAGRKLCAAIMRTDPRHWWYDQVDKSWWVNRGE